MSAEHPTRRERRLNAADEQSFTDRLRQLRRSRPRLVAAAIAAVMTLGALLALTGWATSSPPGSSPDEDWHLASIWCPTPLENSCVTRVNDDGTTSVELPKQLLYAAVCHAFHPEYSGACFDDLPPGLSWTNRLNNGAYPGGFYQVMHAFVGDDLLASVMVMRLANAGLAVALL
ncbi:MAG: DUF2142 domain-containing protein, partial [Promicromonosporaceae bacterium]|nr:DUF2142 domain-containing protein [Promicromonosporaceae bacterium]